MSDSDQVYRDLQKHLNNQAVGFPATQSGAELKILKYIFTPQEAKVATCLSYKFESLEQLYKKAAHLVKSEDELSEILDRIHKKGGIEFKTKDEKKHYCSVPFIVGMYEYQIERMTPEFIEDYDAFTKDINFGIEFLSTEIPQIRTIPIEKSILIQHNVKDFDAIKPLLTQAEGPFVIVECICRKKSEMQGVPCKVTDRKETCLAMDATAESCLITGKGRRISREEAIDIIDKNQKQGLVLQPSNTEKPEFICSCCGCCCGMLHLYKILPNPLDFWASNFHANVDMNLCNGCGVCVKRCQVDAIKLSETHQKVAVDLHRCLGCGVCVPTCPKKAISLQKKKKEITPPKTREDLYDFIMAHKKGNKD
ncbi:MAG: 4Fe-4S dicluster domain-containing protein [Desulfobacterales bacterium]|nr:4Fe-4S dicluster domain-containing protein [Desulfobacterales bacterium]